jgi:hypothetical protein
MPNQRKLGPGGGQWTPRSLKNLALWYDSSDVGSMYTTDAGPVATITDPRDISGLVGWWDASDITTAGSVTTLSDKSGNGYNVTQPNAAERPTAILNALNGKTVLRFDGGDGLQGNISPSISTNTYTVFAVCRLFAALTNGRVFSMGGASADFAAGSIIPICTNATSGTQLSAYTGTGTPNNVSGVSGFGGTFAVFSGSFSAGTVSNAVDGAKAATGAGTLTTAITRVAIGAQIGGGSSALNGEIAEVIYYRTALTAAERASVEAWLGNKYGIPSVHKPVSSESLAVAAPTDLPGCVGWWDSADLSSMKSNSDGTGDITSASVTANTAAVGYWRDKSSVGAHLTQATESKKPKVLLNAVNGNAALTFNRTNLQTLISNNYTATNGLYGMTRFVVMQSTATTDAPMAMKVSTSSYNVSNTFGWQNGSTRFYYNGSNADLAYISAGGSGASITLNIYSDVYTGGHAPTAVAYYGGNPTATVISGTLPSVTGAAGVTDTNLYVGSNTDVNFYWLGPIAEVIIFNRALSSVEVDRIHKYLAQKWGFSGVSNPRPPVGYLKDKSVNARHATQTLGSQRPALSDWNTRRAVNFDGTDDTLLTPSITASSLFDSTGACAWVVYEPNNDTNYGVLRTGTGAAGYERFTNGSSYHAMFRTDRLPAVLPGAPSSGKTILTSAVTGSSHSLHVNGAEYQSFPSSTYALWRAASGQWAIGTDTQPLTGAISEIIVLGRAPTAAEVRRVHAYLSAKWGVTIAPQVSNAEAQNWISRVYAAGGTVSTATAAAVNQFCTTFTTYTALRGLIYRLNLFCGNSDASLIAARTPIYLSPNPTSANLFKHGNDLTNAAWGSSGGAGLPTRAVATTEPSPFGPCPTKLTTPTSAANYQIYQNPSVYSQTVTMSVWLKAATGTVDMQWLQGGAAAGTFTVTTSWANYITTFSMPTYAAQDVRCGLATVTPLTGSQYVLAYGMSLTLGSSLSSYTQPVYGNAMDANSATPFVAADYTELGPNGGLSPNGANKFLDTGLTPAHLPSTRHHLMVYETAKPAGSYRVRIGCRETSGGANTHSITNTVATDTIFYTQGVTNAGGPTVAYAESSGLLIGTSVSASNVLTKNNFGPASSTAINRTAFPAIPYYVFALNNGGAAGDHMNNGRLAAYSIGSFLAPSSQTILANAVQTFQTTLSRLSAGAGSDYSDITNPDALDWMTRVYLNGGSVSPATATAVNTFCNAIDAAGIRDRFFRLNVFAGNSDGALAAVRTPLYLGPTAGGAQYGALIDDNVNFVQSDYSPTTGLTGNTTSGKYLKTGLPVSTFTGNNLHMGVGLYTSAPAPSIGSTLLGFGNAGGAYLMADRLISSLRYFQFGTGASGAGPSSGILDSGNYVASYPLAYRNGLNTGLSATSFANLTSSSDFAVFGQSTGTGYGNTTSSRLTWYSIGIAFPTNLSGMGATQEKVNAFTSAIANLQTALGRTFS